MHKLLFILISLAFIASTSLAQQETTQAPPENGTHKTYYGSGALKSVEKYKNGALSGPAKYYYESGEVSAQTNYKDGLLDGVEKIFHENGKLKRLAKFSAGVMEGTIKFYDNEEKLTSEMNVINGKREGIARVFRADASVKEECVFKDDNAETCSYFDESGKLQARSQRDPENPKRTIYLTFDQGGNVSQAQQSIKE
ncbi:MAG TPA: toxin-antitoxin system YwqK family antitoxin [Candidatus Omnitrophota bacterium]|nr:toxin-antitoxin system YwqK family antitoxin [Candidatus Omnitrophota bacterium]